MKDQGGFKIKILFKKLLSEFAGDYKATAKYTNEDVNYALTIHEGESIPGFPSIDAFYYLLRPQLELLRDPINETFNEVFSYLEFLASMILEKSFARFPQIVNDISELVNQFLYQERDKTKYIIDCIVDQEINYLFTNK